MSSAPLFIGDSTVNDTISIDGGYPSTRFYTNGLLSGIFILAGIAANIVVITSWLCDRGRWLSLYYYFMAFASWNLTLLVSTFFFYSLPALLRQPADQSTIACVPYFYVIGYAGANCCLTAVVWLMVVLTIERFVAVTKPFHTRISSPRRRAKLISATLSVTAILYNIPLIFELLIVGTAFEIKTSDFPITTIGDTPKNSVVYFWTVETAPFRSNFYYQTIYRVIGHLFFISLVPFVIITTLTMKIVLIVRRTNRERVFYRRALDPSTSSIGGISPGGTGRPPPVPHNRHDTHANAAATYGNVLLTVFVIKFLLCYTLPFALNVLELFLPAWVFHTSELMWVTDVSDFLVILDSVSNAFLYFSWRRRITFYKKRAASSFYSKDSAGAAHEYARSVASSPANLSRTSSKRDQAHQQLLRSLPQSTSVQCYRDSGSNGCDLKQGMAIHHAPTRRCLTVAHV